MTIHFEKHNGKVACGKNCEHTTNWRKVTCKTCKKTMEFITARQDSPVVELLACGKTLEEPTPSIEKQIKDGWNDEAIKEASFKPLEYMITEEHLKEINKIACSDTEVVITSDSVITDLLRQALDSKDIKLRKIIKIINEIKGA